VLIEKCMLIAKFFFNRFNIKALKFVYLNVVSITMDGTKDMNFAIILIIQRLKKFLFKRGYQLFLDLGQKYTN